MRLTFVIMGRELAGYFSTPVAYVFLVIFLALVGAFTFFLGGFFDRGQADLQAFFNFHPWLYLFLIPSIGMRLWAEERKTGTIELLLTLPLSSMNIVVGKFLAAWAFTAIALALTFPIWITVNYLGEPDNGVIVASYLGSLLMAGAFLALLTEQCHLSNGCTCIVCHHLASLQWHHLLVGHRRVSLLRRCARRGALLLC